MSYSRDVQLFCRRTYFRYLESLVYQAMFIVRDVSMHNEQSKRMVAVFIQNGAKELSFGDQ